MTRCVTIDQSILEKTKMDKALPRLVRRGDEQGKKFAQEILDNAANITKQKTTGEKSTTNGASTKSSSNGPRSSEANETKTARSEVKKTSTLSNKSSSTTILKSANNSDVRQTTAKADAKPTSKVLGTESSSKPKANVITTKPSAFFSSLKSASKKPGTSSKLEDGKPRLVEYSKERSCNVVSDLLVALAMRSRLKWSLNRQNLRSHSLQLWRICTRKKTQHRSKLRRLESQKHQKRNASDCARKNDASSVSLSNPMIYWSKFENLYMILKKSLAMKTAKSVMLVIVVERVRC